MTEPAAEAQQSNTQRLPEVRSKIWQPKLPPAGNIAHDEREVRPEKPEPSGVISTSQQASDGHETSYPTSTNGHSGPTLSKVWQPKLPPAGNIAHDEREAEEALQLKREEPSGGPFRWISNILNGK